ncbi:MAG: hypothetical protein ACPGWR_02050 [Ardenticatenaceae bacterium]
MYKKFRANSGEELFVDKFVGREDLLAKVDEIVADEPNNHVITLLGEGGIGKTALLRRIYNKYKDDENIYLNTIDYNKSKFKSLPTLANEFFRPHLEDGAITENDILVFQKKVMRAQQAFLENKDEKSVKELQDEAYRFGIGKVKDGLKGRRMLSLTDSIDASHEFALGQEINELASSFDNTVIILAGRPQDAVIWYLENITLNIFRDKKWKIHEIRLVERFTVDETTKYFDKVLPVRLKPELIDTIHILSAGKPILLAFTVEWFKHNVVLPKYINKSKEELEALDEFHLERSRRNFELELIRRVQAAETPLDKALLFLSFLDRRYDKRILQLALKRPLEYVERLEEQLRDMAFIRSFLDDSSGLLHDEAKRLIYEYAWPPYDPRRKDRAKLARKVIDGFYLPEIKKLRAETAAATFKDPSKVSTQVFKETLAHELEMECLDYHYRISFDEGRRYVTKLIGEGISLRKQEGIRDEITKQAGEAEAEVAVARMNLRRGQFEGNQEIVEQALNQKDSSEGSVLASPWYRTTLLYELSDAHPEPQKKAAYLMQAIEIAEQSPDQEASAKIYNDLGLMYQRHGLFAEAEETYQKRLAFVDDPEQKAATLNNLALVKLLQGEIDQAKSLAGMALER